MRQTDTDSQWDRQTDKLRDSETGMKRVPFVIISLAATNFDF